jgi:hypothetical protein
MDRSVWVKGVCATVGLSLVAVLGCGLDPALDEERRAVSMFESRVGLDLARLHVDIADLTIRASQLGARDEVPECEVVFGDCALCPTFDGDALVGEAALTLADACTETSTAGGWATTYEVVASDLRVSYEGETAGSYDIDGTGSRTAFLALDAGADSERWTVSWTLDRLAAGTDAGVIEYLSMGMTYSDFEGLAWTVEAAGDGSSLSGTASHDRGGMCSILGTWDAVAVDCDLLGSEL